MEPIVGIIIAVLTLLLGLAVGFYISRAQTEKAQRNQRDKAEKALQETREQARNIELQARDNALKISRGAEVEITRLRTELSREDERLQKRRAELDSRVEKMEQREQAVNKHQSAVDKRANEIEKMHEQEMVELQRVAQMNVDDARTILLAEVEKDARNDMARIIRQIES